MILSKSHIKLLFIGRPETKRVICMAMNNTAKPIKSMFANPLIFSVKYMLIDSRWGLKA